MAANRVLSREQLRSFRVMSVWMWRRWKGYRTQALLNMTIGLLIVCMELGFVWATKLTIDIATGVDHETSLQIAAGLLIAISIAEILLGIASRWVRAILGVKAQNYMRRSLFERLLHAEWRGLRRFHSGNVINRMERDVQDVIVFLTETLPSFVTTCVQFFGAFLFLFWMDGTLACIVVAIIPFFIFCSRLYMRRVRRLTHSVRNTEGSIQSVLQESLQHSLIIKTLEQTAQTVGRLSGLQSRLCHEVVERTKCSTISSTLMNVGFSAGYLVAFIWGVVNLQAGLITYGALIAFIQLVGQIQGPVRAMTRFVPLIINSFTAGERLMELEEIELETAEKPQRMKGKVGLHVENVTFAYEDGSRDILKNFSFDFPPESITAILGETGAGKTTLIRLLLALITPKEGNIVLRGEDGKEAEIAPHTRCNFSYVPQGNTLMSGTIRENLMLGNYNATDEQLWEALDIAAADFVKKLPNGLDTHCGELGDGLSEGQAQRLSIARALLKDSPILLLDEATSALDSKTEHRVIAAIVKRYAGRTLIFITHRPEVLKYCTQQLHLEKLVNDN